MLNGTVVSDQFLEEYVLRSFLQTIRYSATEVYHQVLYSAAELKTNEICHITLHKNHCEKYTGFFRTGLCGIVSNQLGAQRFTLRFESRTTFN